MNEHAHARRSRSGTEDIAYCRCGYEQRNGRKKWMPPTSVEGKRMRQEWESAQ